MCFLDVVDFIERRAGEIELVDHALVADEIYFAALIGTEGSNSLWRNADLPHGFQRAFLLGQPPDAMRRVITTNVNAVERRPFIAAINVAAGDRIAVIALVGKD